MDDSECRSANNINEANFPSGPTLAYDAKGNLTTYGGLTLGYDAFNRLAVVTGTNSRGDAVNITYAYDALGRRVRRDSSSAGATVDYVLSGEQVIEERDPNDDDTTLRQYLWGQYVDELVQQKEYARAPEGKAFEDYYLVSNLLYSAVGLARGTCPSPRERFVEVYDMDAYGRTQVFSGPGADGKWFTDDDVVSCRPKTHCVPDPSLLHLKPTTMPSESPV